MIVASERSRRIGCGTLLLSLLIGACHGTTRSNRTFAPAAAAPTPVPIVPIQGIAAAAKFDQGGVLTATVDPTSAATQVVQASATSTIKAAKVAFPPGSVAISTDVSLQAGAPIANETTRSELGLDKSKSLTAAGAAVVVSSSTGLDAAQPFTLAIPLDQAALALDGSAYAVVYRAFHAGKLVVGLIPSGDLQVGGGLVQFTSKLFGSYQAVVATGLPETAQQAASATPIASASGQTVSATGPATPPDAGKIVTPPGAFAISAPPALGNVGMPDIKWSASANASAYDLTLSITTSCPTSVQTHTGITGTDFVPAALPDGTYFVCIKAKNIAGTVAPSNDSYAFTIKTTPPGAFAITAPVTATNSATPTVSWAASPAAVSYDVAVSAISACSSPSQTFAGVTSRSQTLASLSDGTYYVCVTAHDAAGNTLKASSSFAIKTVPPGMFTINGPPHGTFLVAPTITWTSSSSATTYAVTIASDAACTQNTSVSNVSTTTMTVAAPLPAQALYYVCVAATDPAGNTRAASNNGYPFVIGTLAQGQPDPLTNSQVTHGLFGLQGVSSDGTHFFVADTSNNRVLIWNSLPASGQQVPDVVLGQPDKSSNAANNGGISGKSMYNPTAVFSDGTHVVVADTQNHRLLMWNTFPTTTGQSADVVLGQADMNHGAINGGAPVTATTLSQPQDLAISGAKLLVVDQGNQRVLIWNTLPTANQQGADLVIGQTSLSATGSGCAANTFVHPMNLATDGTTLVISDPGGYRALIYPSIPSTNNAAATFALGQTSLTSCVNPGPSPGQNTLKAPLGVAVRAAKLYVADQGHNRVLVWSPIPSSNDANATAVIGQSDFVSNPAATTQSGFTSPSGLGSDPTNLYVADSSNNRVMVFQLATLVTGVNATSEIGQAGYGGSDSNSYPGPGTTTAQLMRQPTGGDSDGRHLIVADRGQNRVLIWNTIPTASGSAANIVLGQSNLASYSPPSTTQSTFGGAVGACTDGTHVAVADSGSSRVLIWNSFPTASGQNADLVLGQSNFSGAMTNGGGSTSATTLSAPRSVSCSSGKLIVADTGNHRVLIWNTFPTTTQQAADVVVGQTGMTGSVLGTSAGALFNPGSATSDGTRLLVADTNNNRVLVWNTVPTTNGMAANYALGQPGLVTGTAGVPSNSSLAAPQGVTVNAGRVFVADTNNNRVLVWSLATLPAGNTSSGIAADSVFGQATFTETGANAGGYAGTSLNLPYSIFSDSTWVYIPDNNDNRLLMAPL